MVQIIHPWMYGNRLDAAFREGVKSFLLVAERNRNRKGFMCCPCVDCRNEKDYSSSRDIQSHLLRRGFMPGYNVWTKHGEEGVMMEDGDEEDNDDYYRSMFPEYGDTAMEDNEEEGGEGMCIPQCNFSEGNGSRKFVRRSEERRVGKEC